MIRIDRNYDRNEHECAMRGNIVGFKRVMRVSCEHLFNPWLNNEIVTSHP